MRCEDRAVVYIDGFNLYFGIRQGGRRHLWLDLEQLARRLLKPDQRLVAVRYFTASVRNDPPAELRQQTYLSALAAHSGDLLSISLGRFQQRPRRCRSCASSWTEYEEKESDVSLAVSLLEDAANDLYDTALIISADSDMCPAVRAVKRLRPAARVIAVPPPHRRSDALQRLCDATVRLSMTKVRQSQLPDLVSSDGHVYERPAHWKPGD